MKPARNLQIGGDNEAARRSLYRYVNNLDRQYERYVEAVRESAGMLSIDELRIVRESFHSDHSLAEAIAHVTRWRVCKHCGAPNMMHRGDGLPVCSQRCDLRPGTRPAARSHLPACPIPAWEMTGRITGKAKPACICDHMKAPADISATDDELSFDEVVAVAVTPPDDLGFCLECGRDKGWHSETCFRNPMKGAHRVS